MAQRNAWLSPDSIVFRQKSECVLTTNRGSTAAINDRRFVELATSRYASRARENVTFGSSSFAADVSDARDVAAMVSSVEKELGPIDILVNNAGIAVLHSLEDITETDFDHTIAVNLKSAFLCTQAVWPGMRARRWGRIVNISSGAARGAGGFGVHYNASKAGMEGLTRGYAARLLSHGITVNAVAPSLIDTEMIASQRETIAATLPLKRLGTSEEVAAVVVMVVTNAYMTGQTVHVNGGRQFN